MRRRCVLLGLLLWLVGCSRQEEPPPLPDPVVSPPPPPATVEPISTGAPGPLPTLPPVPTTTAAPPAPPHPTTPAVQPAAIQIPWTPYTIPIPPVLPIPVPVGLPTALPLPTFPFPTTTTAPTTAPPTPTTPPTVAPPAASNDRVIVFGTQWCRPCKNLQADLRRRQVPFTFVDLEDPEAMKTPAGARAAEIPPNKRGGIPLTRVVLKNGALDWVTGADGERIERGYRG
ncbi:MAG: hypothetical protein RMJ98_16140 [Myxococcales bacterium]|nr:hypothetical protein [Polyangiaceae bacterium]MDW8250827.1 hypothetical protein [Myxococcales bacterium]